MKGKVGTATYLTKLFPKTIKNIIDTSKLPKEAKVRFNFISYYLKHKNISKTCRHFGISRRTFYKWFERYKKFGIDGLYNRPKTPNNKRKPEIRNKYKQEIIAIRQKYPTWSKEKIASYLHQEKGIKISPSTVYRVLKEASLIERYKAKKEEERKRKKEVKKRTKKGLKASFPGEVVQIDVKHLPWKGKTYYQFTAIDKYSRLSYAKLYKTKTSNKAKEFFMEMEKYFGFKIKKVQTDNGSEFLGEFNKYLNEIGVEHYYSYPRSPKTNANVERVIRTIEEELWFIEGLDFEIDELNKKLMRYIRIYNFIRPHHALGYRRPADLAYGM